MTVRRSKRWICGMAALLIAAPPFALWLFKPAPEPLQPIARFLPDRLAAAARIGDLAGAWHRHWIARGGKTTPESALQDFLDAQGKWEKMVAKEGEMQAQARIKLIPRFLFQTIGKESWLLFGEWDGAGPVAEPGPSAAVLEKARLAQEAKDKKAAAKKKKKKASSSAAKTSAAASAVVASDAMPQTTIRATSETRAIKASPSADEEGGMVGLVLILPGGGSLKSTIAPLAEFLLGKEYDTTLQRSDGTIIYLYESIKSRRCLAVASAGGRIVISLRRRGAGPLPAIIKHLHDPQWNPPADSGAAALAAAETSRTQSESVFATLRPELLFEQAARMQAQRAKTPSKTARKLTKLWETRLAGIDRLTLRQAGESLLDLDLLAERIDGKPTSATTAIASAGQRVKEIPAAPVLEADLGAGLLRDALARMAIDAKADGINPLALELFIPGVLANFERALDKKSDPAERVGAALFPSSVPLMARVLLWNDRSPLMAPADSPAGFWGMIAEGLGKGGRGDTVRREGSQEAGDAKPDPEWERFAAAQWSAGGLVPGGFVAVDFGVASQYLDRVPAELLKKDARKKLKSYQGLLRGLALAAGGATLRLDDFGDRSVLQLRTMAAARTAAP